MTTVEVFDPPMCCSTGVCGPSVDSALARCSADLHRLTNQGIRVERYNLSQQAKKLGVSRENMMLAVQTAQSVKETPAKAMLELAHRILSGDRVLVERELREQPYVAEVRDHLATRFAVIPWKSEAPGGPEMLPELAASSFAFAHALKG